MFCFCVALSVAELLGPETKKEIEKNDDEDETPGSLDSSPSKVDPEYIKELTDAVNKEIVTLQEYADALRKTKGVADEEPNRGRYLIRKNVRCKYLSDDNTD